MKKIVIFGGQQITINCIEILKRNRQAKVIAVVGCEKLEDRIYGYPSIKNYCQKNNLLFFQPNKLDDNFLKLFQNWNPDLAFSLYYRYIFQKRYLSVPTMGFINIHPSLLPKYRGQVPSLWALLNNTEVTGVTLHYIDEGIDTGDIIEQITYKIPGSITGFELNNKLMHLGAKLFQRYLSQILYGQNRRIKQDHSKATYYGPYHPAMRKINWFLPTEGILCQIRAFTKPYAGAVTSILNRKTILWKASPVKLSNRNLGGPAKIIKVLPNKFIVSTVDGFILVDSFEIPELTEKNYMDFIRAEKRFDLF